MSDKQLSKRALIALAWMATNSDERELSMFRNCGKKTVQEIKNFIKETTGQDLKQLPEWLTKK